MTFGSAHVHTLRIDGAAIAEEFCLARAVERIDIDEAVTAAAETALALAVGNLVRALLRVATLLA